jgi:hypothetical protein
MERLLGYAQIDLSELAHEAGPFSPVWLWSNPTPPLAQPSLTHHPPFALSPTHALEPPNGDAAAAFPRPFLARSNVGEVGFWLTAMRSTPLYGSI